MNRIHLVIVGAAALASSLAAGFLARPRVDRGLVASVPVAKLGVRGQGEEIPVEFELRNDSNMRIQILDVLRNCECVDPTLGDVRVMTPGQRAVLKAVWHTRTRRGPSSTDMTIAYLTEKGESRYTRLELEATVEPDYEVAPDHLTFVVGGEGGQSLLFRPLRVPELNLLSVTCSDDAFTATLDRDHRAVVVMFDASKRRLDAGDAELRVLTDSPHEPTFVVPLKVRQ